MVVNTLCKGALAIPADEFVYNYSFIPLKIIDTSDSVISAEELNFKTILSNVHKLIIPPFAKQIRSIINTTTITEKKNDVDHKNTINVIVHENINVILSHFYREFTKKLIEFNNSSNLINIEDCKGKINKHGANIYKVIFEEPTSLFYNFKNNPTLDQFLSNYNKRYKLFPPRSSATLSNISDDLGILLSERTRIRPIGYTVEMAPFTELTLDKGWMVSAKKTSTIKQTSTTENTVETLSENNVTESSKSNIEFTDEYAKMIESTNGYSANLSFNIPVTENISIGGGGAYTASNVERTNNSLITKKFQEISKKIETKQKLRHATKIITSTENTFESESSLLYRNDDDKIKKLLFRRMMKVLHISHERFDANLCWTPCIKDPGSMIREYTPNREDYPDEIAEIESKVYEGCISKPQYRTRKSDPVYHENGLYDNRDYEYHVDIRIPEFYEYYDAWVEADTSSDNGASPVSVQNYRVIGDNILRVNVKADLGFNDTFSAIVYAKFKLTDEAKNDSSLQEPICRANKIQEEIDNFLARKKREINENFIPNASLNSEIMRRIITKYFGSFQPSSCSDINNMMKLFDWEKLSFKLFPKWWNDTTLINGKQSPPINFHNAGMAKIFLPLKYGNEEEAITLLHAAGILNVSDPLDYMREYIDIITTLKNTVYKDPEIDSTVAKTEIIKPCSIDMTPIKSDDWNNNFEHDDGFNVLGRYAIVIPTDGIDIEETNEFCNTTSSPEILEEDT